MAAVAHMPEAKLQSALERLIGSGLLFQQGSPPHASYLFKHALVQDAAYGTLLRKPDARCTPASRKRSKLNSARLPDKAGLRSLERSAFIEAAEQLARALSQLEALPSTPERRQKQMKLQTLLIAPLIQTKGYAASETKDAVERAHLLIERVNAIREPPEIPELLFLVLSGYFTENIVAGNVEACRDVADRVLELAEKQGRLAELVLGHLCVGTSLLLTGEIARGKMHLDHAVTLYDPALPRTSMAREDPRVAALIFRSIALWMLGYPEAALADAIGAIKNARAVGSATPLMFALAHAELTYRLCGNYAAEASVYASSSFWRT